MGFTSSIDYLGFTVRGVPLSEVTAQLGGTFCQMEKGFRGYPVGYVGVSDSGGTGMIGTGAPRNPGEIHVDLPGGFLAGWTFAQLQKLAKWVRSKNGTFTRLDLALDDRLGIVTIAQVQRALRKGQVVTRFKEMTRLDKMGFHASATRSGDTLNIGSRQSQTFIRVYDKALEQQDKGHAVEGPWVRWEMELKEERANVCGQALASLDEEEFRRLMVGVLRSAIDFRQTTWEAEAIERFRAKPLKWWLTLTEGFQKARLVVTKAVRKIEDVKAWVSQSLAPMLAVVACAPGAGEEWLRKAIATGADRWKPKHLLLLKRPPPMKEYRLRPC